MIGTWLRSVAAVLAGLVVAAALIAGVEAFSEIVHPFPADVDSTDFEVCKAHVARYPAWVLVVASAAWGFTTFVSAWLATRLGPDRHRAHGYVVGAILLVLVVINMGILPYPSWFWVSNLIAFPLGFYWGAKLGGPRASIGNGSAADRGSN